MPLVRVYLSLDLAGLSSLHSSGEVGPAPVAAHAPLAASTRPGLGNDDEEREYAAWSAAVSEAADRAPEGGRRIVASADVDAATVRRVDADGSAVEVDAVIPLSRIASFHVDEEPGGDVSDLLWYDVTELDEVATVVSRAGNAV